MLWRQQSSPSVPAGSAFISGRRTGVLVRTMLGAAFLLLQLGWLLLEQRGPTRYFCWAPNDYMTRYRIEARVGGRPLSRDEILRRYHVEPEALSETVPQHLINI